MWCQWATTHKIPKGKDVKNYRVIYNIQQWQQESNALMQVLMSIKIGNGCDIIINETTV